MSVVTSVAVMAGYLSDNDEEYLNTFVWGDGSPGRRATWHKVKNCDEFGGSKCGEVDILLGAFNHFEHDRFIEFLKKYRFYDGITVWMDSDGHSVTVYMQEKDGAGEQHVYGFDTYM